MWIEGWALIGRGESLGKLFERVHLPPRSFELSVLSSAMPMLFLCCHNPLLCVLTWSWLTRDWSLHSELKCNLPPLNSYFGYCVPAIQKDTRAHFHDFCIHNLLHINPMLNFLKGCHTVFLSKCTSPLILCSCKTISL